MKELKSYTSSYDLIKDSPITSRYRKRRFDWIDLVCWLIAASALGSLVWWWLYW